MTGMSRTSRGHGANVVYIRLWDRGDTVFAIDSNGGRVAGHRSFQDLRSVPGEEGGDRHRSEIAEDAMRDCVQLGVTQV